MRSPAKSGMTTVPTNIFRQLMPIKKNIPYPCKLLRLGATLFFTYGRMLQSGDKRYSKKYALSFRVILFLQNKYKTCPQTKIYSEPPFGMQLLINHTQNIVWLTDKNNVPPNYTEDIARTYYHVQTT